MIVYLDASALVKHYVVEAGSTEVNQLLVRADVVGTAAISRAEVAAALAKAARMDTLTRDEAEAALQVFRAEWVDLVRLQLTEAMAALKQIAAMKNLAQYKQSTLFYKKFMDSVRRHSRVREMEFMSLYFASMRNPLIPLRFAPLGMKLMAKRKLSIQFPLLGKAPLESIFRKVEEMEGRER